MEWLVLLVVLLIVLAVVAAKLKSHGGQPTGYPYTRNQVLFSPAERSFLGVLEQAVGNEYRILGKVRVADVISVKPMSSRPTWQRAFNRISAKHFDFVLCSKDDLAIVAAIELNDRSHQQRRRQERDSFLIGLCHAVALPLVQVPAQRAYSMQEVRARVLSALDVRQECLLELPRPSMGAPDVQAQIESEQEVFPPVTVTPQLTESEAPACPKCSARMVRRVVKSGANAGQAFWGCSTFPKCRTILPVSA